MQQLGVAVGVHLGEDLEVHRLRCVHELTKPSHPRDPVRGTRGTSAVAPRADLAKHRA
jgi:hypothetical protein